VKRIGLLLLTLIFVLLVLSRLVTDGMFLDGVLYAVLSKNLAQGVGTIWDLRVSAEWGTWHEHPPLVLVLQSMFFKVLGNGYATERMYCGLVTVLSMALMARIWRQVLPPAPYAAWWPLPLLLWLLNEDVYLSYSSNMLECTLTVFTLLAVHLYLRAEAAVVPSQRAMALVVGAFCVFLAFLCKGLVALYPLAFFGIAALAQKEKTWARGARYTIYSIALVLAFGGLLLLHTPARSALAQYFDQQVWAALMGKRNENIALHRLFILERFLTTHAHWFVVLAAVWWAARKYGRKAVSRAHWPAVVLFGGLAAAALLPIVVSPKQAAHYVVPSLPWAALALGAVFAGLLEVLPTVRPPRWLAVVLGLGIVAALAWVGTRVGQVRPDLAELRPIMERIPHGIPVGFHEKNGPTYVLEAYFQRYHEVRTNRASFEESFVVVEAGVAIPTEHAGHLEEIPTPSTRFKLYKYVK
jgi:hypothetical protein